MAGSALVLEGGALRGTYTTGVLDVLLENNIEFPFVLGVSAGALNAISYISKQKGRGANININYANNPRYMSFYNLIKKHNYFNFDFMFGELSEKLVPLDYEAFYASTQRFIAVATDCETGKPCFFEKNRKGLFFEACKASAGMPLISSITNINNVPYLDGGISLPVPYQKAISEGCDKIVIVLTRNKGFRKKEISFMVRNMYKYFYKKFPFLIKTLENMPNNYNTIMDEIDALEESGKVFVIRPQKPVIISRNEKDTSKLKSLYQDGVNDTKNLLGKLNDYLKTNITT